MKHINFSSNYKKNSPISSFYLCHAMSNPSCEGSATTIGGGKENLTLAVNRRSGLGGRLGSLIVLASNNLALCRILSWKIYNTYKKNKNLHMCSEFEML
jgi:hypothetical protein